MLKEKVKKLQISNSVEFIGHIDNQETIKNYYKNSDVFILPSFSENFGMSILESLTYGCPVIVTKNTPWESVVENHCGWWVDLSVDEIVKALEKYSEMDDESRLEMRKRCIKLSAKFDLKQVGQDMNLAYKNYCKS